MPAIKETYLINETDFQSFRLIGNDVDFDTVDPYILEAQFFDLRPVLNDAFYTDFLKRINDDVDPLFGVYQELLNGKEYAKSDGVVIRFPGIRPFLVYSAFNRLIQEHSVNVTRFGMVVKSSDQSQPADAAAIRIRMNSAKDRAAAYQVEVIKFLTELKTTYPIWDNEGQSNNRFNNQGFRFFKG